MKNVTLTIGKKLSRRTVLRGAGVAISLPFLDAMRPAWLPVGLHRRRADSSG